MKKMGLVLALVSALSMVTLPVAPSFAASPAPQRTAEQTIAKHAARGEVAILSQGQMNQLAVSHPALYAKLSAAHQSGTAPKLTKSEKAYVRGITAQNMDSFKAGDPATVWIVVAVVAAVLLLFSPWFCNIFPWGLGCRPMAAPVRVRG